MTNAEGITSLVQQAILSLDEGTSESPAITDLLGKVSDALEGLARLDSSQAHLSEQVRILFENLNDLVLDLRSYLENIEYNPRRLDQVEERLALIQSLKRKYGEAIPEVLEYAVQAKIKLERFTHSGERLQELEDEHSRLLLQIGKEGNALSQYRQRSSTKAGECD